MHKLRPHQEVFVNSVLQKLETHNKILGQAACGFGKTLCMTGFVEKTSFKTLILVNSIDLLNQTVETFERQKIDLGTFTSKDKKFPLKSNVVAMTETLKKRIIKNPKLVEHFDLIIIDECHVIIYEILFKYFKDKKIDFSQFNLIKIYSNQNLNPKLDQTKDENLPLGLKKKEEFKQPNQIINSKSKEVELNHEDLYKVSKKFIKTPFKFFI